jgi:hypothetical protein
MGAPLKDSQEDEDEEEEEERMIKRKRRDDDDMEYFSFDSEDEMCHKIDSPQTP